MAIENARLYELQSPHWARQLESLDEITNAIAERDRAGATAADRRRSHERAPGRALRRPSSWRRRTAGWRSRRRNGNDAEELVGERLAVQSSKAGRVFLEGMPARVDSVLDDPDADPEFATRRLGARAGLWVPLIARTAAIGVLMALDRRRGRPAFTDSTSAWPSVSRPAPPLRSTSRRRVARTTMQRMVAGAGAGAPPARA